MEGGYTGRYLAVDLAEQTWAVEETPEDLCNEFLGGRGFGVALLRGHITKDPFSPDMPLIIATGPLVGTPSPTSGRFSVISRSPLTGTVFDCSVGGRFGTRLKKAGFDFVVFTGTSPDWVRVDITREGVVFNPAHELAGLSTGEVMKHLDKDLSYGLIGPAGERFVSFASIVFDGHYLAGRGGLGAVMGAKHLKLITVRGDGAVRVYSEEKLKKARENVMRLLRATPAIFGEFGLSNFGTAALVDLIHARRMEPTMNFRQSFFPDSGKYSGYRMKTVYDTKKTGCAGCPILCKKQGSGGEVIPEFETASHFGALNENNDLSSIVEANHLCNDYGLDTISTASTIACYSEIQGRSFSPEELLSHIKLIGEREGIGDALAEGSLRYAGSQGVPELSMTVKGLELPAYDPRGAYGMALAYATSNRGACHLRAYPISYEILRKPVAVNRFSFEGKARMVKISEDMNAVIDSLTACKFVFFGASLEEYAEVLNAVTGTSHDVQSLLAIGERIWDIEREMNRMNGFTWKDDNLPERFFREAGYEDEKVVIPPIDRDAFLDALRRYYRIRGYEESTE